MKPHATHQLQHFLQKRVILFVPSWLSDLMNLTVVRMQYEHDIHKLILDIFNLKNDIAKYITAIIVTLLWIYPWYMCVSDILWFCYSEWQKFGCVTTAGVYLLIYVKKDMI